MQGLPGKQPDGAWDAGLGSTGEYDGSRCERFRHEGCLGALAISQAKRRGIQAFILDSPTRDLPAAQEVRLPAFAGALTMGLLDRGPGAINQPIR
jgi:regulator of RNase E activity RraA